MRAICFIQETKDSDLTQRQQQLICPPRPAQNCCGPACGNCSPRPAPRNSRSRCGPGMVDLMRAAAAGEVDVLIVTDIPHLHCSRAELDGLLMSLLQYGVHTFGANDGQWIEPGGRHWDGAAGV